jgi:hypothetical protein
MKITGTMVVPESALMGAFDLHYCSVEKARTFHVPQQVMVLSKSGARTMRLWACENHPLPDTVTDDPSDTIAVQDETAKPNATITVAYGDHAVTITLEGHELSENGRGHRFLNNASSTFISSEIERALVDLVQKRGS